MLKRLALSLIAATLLFGPAAPSFAADVIFQIVTRHRTVQEGDRDLCINRDAASGEMVVHDGYVDEFDCEAAGHVWADEARRGRMGFGDIILVRSGDFDSFGTKECYNYPPAAGGVFTCLYIDGLTLEEAKRLIKPLLINDRNIEVEERRYYLDINSLPPEIKNALLQSGEATISWENARAYVIDKKTGESR